MKRFSFSAICVLALVAVCGCIKNETAASRTQKTTASVSDVIQQRIAETDANNTANGTQVVPLEPQSAPVQNDAQVAPLATNSDSAPLATNSNPAPLATGTASSATPASNSAPTPETQTTPPAPARKKPEPIKSESVSVDVDLTTLSSTMVYSEVLNIMTYPETYVGKTVKMRGIFAYYHDEQTDQYYFGCIIQDATACCAQGIEFILTDDYLFPDDYPKEGEIVTVAGEFDIYKENGLDYFTLKNSKLLV